MKIYNDLLPDKIYNGMHNFSHVIQHDVYCFTHDDRLITWTKNYSGFSIERNADETDLYPDLP